MVQRALAALEQDWGRASRYPLQEATQQPVGQVETSLDFGRGVFLLIDYPRRLPGADELR